ncbi:hypothetical protein HPB49_007720 [Dermacentor silvarum]|uniref:Uncharacterized protein n=1 Tax=Dermacentor silvarum TaxID=543639 RepID=A0ACB8CK38_DERSI|nr:hypothetical protein HPB49_007720 [Dermacentor silvarum]
MSIKTIKIEDKDHEVTACMVAPENCGKWVVHGMDIRMTEEAIMEGFAGHEQNPEILGIRRMRRSTTVVITFAEAEVPRTLVCFGMIMKCFLFKKRYEVCYRCSELGHRSDVCNSPEAKCRGCGMSSPPEDHQCVPKCRLCGKEHLTGDKKCTVLFRTPYIVKKRQWQAKLAAEPEEKKAPKTALSNNNRCDAAVMMVLEIDPRARRGTTRHRSPGLHRRRESKSSQKGAPPNSQVGWADKGSQDSAMVKALKQQNRLMQEQIRTMQQNRELREQITLLNKRIDEGAQKGEKEVSQSVSETRRADPPPKKKRVKDIETVNNYEQRFDKIEQDMKLLHGMIQQMNEQMRAEAANRDGNGNGYAKNFRSLKMAQHRNTIWQWNCRGSRANEPLFSRS